MTDTGRCEWDGAQLREAQLTTCSSRCRGRRWRWLNDVKRAHGQDPEPPPWSDSPLHGRMGEAARSNTPPQAPGPRSGANARSGLILSYPKAVTAAQDALRGYVIASGCSHADADEEIEAALRGALSIRMRARLEARDA